MTLRFWLLIAALVIVVAAIAISVPRLEGTPPVIGKLPAITLGTAEQTLRIEVTDPDSGLRSIEVRLQYAGGSKHLLSRELAGGPLGGHTEREVLELTLAPGALGLPDGPATLIVIAHDWSWRDGFAGNESELAIPLRVDTVPPRLSVESGLTYVYRGGSGAAVYTVGEVAARDGVRVGDAFFPGFAIDSSRADSPDGRRVAIFAVPVDAPRNPEVRVVAADAAGNESEAGFAVRIFDRSFEQRAIELSTSFLRDVAVPLAKAQGLARSDPTSAFREVNETLRERNEAQVREALANPTKTRHWHGGFEQMRGSKVTSRFAEQRTYLVRGRKVSSATHYGFDLASTSEVAVTAANAGVVVHAGDLGIYGSCVLIDHGFGVSSLYAHLSDIGVAVGDVVGRGQTIGRSGSTGLAGGDHLHFAVLVGGEYVDPLEWWDAKWVRDHVEVRLGDASQ